MFIHQILKAYKNPRRCLSIVTAGVAAADTDTVAGVALAGVASADVSFLLFLTV